ncbi:hypothetical protein Tco_0327472 [Tanacetum coccineum]
MLSATPKLLSGIEDSHHGPSDAIYNPPHPLKVGKTLFQNSQRLHIFLSTFSLLVFTMKMEILPVSTSNNTAVGRSSRIRRLIQPHGRMTKPYLSPRFIANCLIAYSYKDGVEMTTTVVNNSVFRAFFEKQRLTGPKFMDWYRNLRIMLLVEDKLPYLEQPIPTMPIPPAGQVLPSDVLTSHSNWVKASKEIVGLMLMTMEPDIQKNLEQLGAYDILTELKSLFAQQAGTSSNHERV